MVISSWTGVCLCLCVCREKSVTPAQISEKSPIKAELVSAVSAVSDSLRKIFMSKQFLQTPEAPVESNVRSPDTSSKHQIYLMDRVEQSELRC